VAEDDEAAAAEEEEEETVAAEDKGEAEAEAKDGQQWRG